MDRYREVRQMLAENPRTWLVTGCAGFIGSNLVQTLLALDQKVVGLDNLSTGYLHNLGDVRQEVAPGQWNNFRFVHGDIRNPETCAIATSGADIVLHQAALGSVPRSLADPVASHDVNVTGFVNMLVAARDAKVKRFVYAASSATYGDHAALPKVEDRIGSPLSPYAVTKLSNEIYASVFSRCYGVRSIGLRYFNVFGKRQDPDGAYAAVIPRWIGAMLRGDEVVINGDGATSRDFCHVENAVQANILAAVAPDENCDAVYNVAVGESLRLDALSEALRGILRTHGIDYRKPVLRRDFRPGDVRHSLASIARARAGLGYAPIYSVKDGLALTVAWYVARERKAGAPVPVQPEVHAL